MAGTSNNILSILARSRCMIASTIPYEKKILWKCRNPVSTRRRINSEVLHMGNDFVSLKCWTASGLILSHSFYRALMWTPHDGMIFTFTSSFRSNQDYWIRRQKYFSEKWCSSPLRFLLHILSGRATVFSGPKWVKETDPKYGHRIRTLVWGPIFFPYKLDFRRWLHWLHVEPRCNLQ